MIEVIFKLDTEIRIGDYTYPAGCYIQMEVTNTGHRMTDEINAVFGRARSTAGLITGTTGRSRLAKAGDNLLFYPPRGKPSTPIHKNNADPHTDPAFGIKADPEFDYMQSIREYVG